MKTCNNEPAPAQKKHPKDELDGHEMLLQKHW